MADCFVASGARCTLLVALGWIARLFPPGVGSTPEAPAAARKALLELGALSRDEWLTAIAFLFMVGGWVFGDKIHLSATSVAFAGLGFLLMTSVLTAKDIATQGDTLSTFLWLAVLYALSSQLNELGFMRLCGPKRLAAQLGEDYRGR